MKMSKWAICALVGSMGLAGAASADISYTDTEFAAANWGFETATLGTGGTSAAAQVGGGNPGNARQLTNVINGGGAGSIFGFSRFGTTNATRYEPNVQGAIASVDWSIDSRWISGFGGQGHSISLGAKQGSVLYIADIDITGSSGAWTGHGAIGLTAANFQPLISGAPIDFSAAGAPLRFGFIVGNSGESAYNNVVMYDNFNVTLRNIPAPGAAMVFGLAGLAASRRRRAAR